MKIWDKLLQVDLSNKEHYQKLFSKLVYDIQEGRFPFVLGEQEKEDYYIVQEENRNGSYFIHVVPKGVYPLFKEMQEKAPNAFLGYSVLAGKKEGRDIRASCFGVPCNLLGKALLKK